MVADQQHGAHQEEFTYILGKFLLVFLTFLKKKSKGLSNGIVLLLATNIFTIKLYYLFFVYLLI